MNAISGFFKQYWVRFVIAFGIGITLFVVYLAAYTSAQSWTLLLYYCNASFLAGAVLFLFSLLTILNYFGGFDIFSFYMMRKPVDEHRKENFYEYCERKKGERRKFKLVFLPYMIISVLFLIATLVTFLLLPK